MFLAAQLYQHQGLRRLRTAGVRTGPPIQMFVCLIGVICLIYALIVRSAIGSLTLWVRLVLLLDPIDLWLDAPSIIADWRAGQFRRTLSLMVGAATCGLLWEFWNY